MLTRLILAVLFSATLMNTANAMSFLDREHGEKLKKEATTAKEGLGSLGQKNLAQSVEPSIEQLSPLEMFASPIQPGGKGLQVNWMNVLRVAAPKLAKKLDKGRSLIDLWVETQVAADEEIAALNSDPRPDKDYKKKLKALKERKKAEYKDRAISMAIAAGMKL